MAHTRDDVVAGALRVLDGFGLEFCSMRRVAAELDVQASALYHHVPNKQTLLALMADRIVDGVEVTQDVAASMHRLREAMLAIRDGADVVATATAFRLGTSAVEEALIASIGPDVARTLLIYVVGHTQTTQLHRQAADAGAITLDPDLDASFERGLGIILR
ncbi:transcriptional regulator, TetR family [Aeromicrobium marinum DSM 15272]|uniref:Transcriptional regulator, TetR family n=1 Tax=Aeromicrobium marinum DSM 15272 TaxID=585531 RepID=E2SFF4_9ACTN|nr:TetR family transcriptional regulator [Aeromicrobium marinum]EFQ82055.1 transcriptional regulator, TetR family [Aeromicrobium marinum DSM 15272]